MGRIKLNMTRRCRRHKDEIEKYKADAEKLPGIQKELKKLQDDADANGRDPYKVKYEAMKEEWGRFCSGY